MEKMEIIHKKNLSEMYVNFMKNDENENENKKRKKGEKILLEKTEKVKKIKYVDGYLYVYPKKNNRKKGICFPSLAFSEVKNIEYNNIKFKNLEDMYYSSIKLKSETMAEFKEKQSAIIKNGGRTTDDLDAEKYFIGNIEYNIRDFRLIIFSFYKDYVLKNKDYYKLRILYKERKNIIIAGETAYTDDINDIDKPYMVEGMLSNILRNF